MSSAKINDADWLLGLAQRLRSASIIVLRRSDDDRGNLTKMSVVRRNMVADAIEKFAESVSAKD